MQQQSMFMSEADLPLAARLRPRTLEEFVGQTHLLGEGKVLRRLIEGDRIGSMIFWGPPGVGKTTLARIIANKTKATFIDFSAVTSGIKEIKQVMEQAEKEGKTTVRLHTGDPCLYGAIREQMDALDERNISYDYCPGVSSFCGAAAALNLEYTLPDVSQSVIITRMAGRTPVPAREEIASFAAHHATMVIFLSTGMLKKLSERLIAGGYEPETPAAIVYKATWQDEKKVLCTVAELAKAAEDNQITKTALIIVGDVVSHSHYRRSDLYNPAFATEFRPASE